MNYKTLTPVRLCLRSIRKFTRFPHKVIVVDNDSRDESLEYLKSLQWIHLIELNFKHVKRLGSEAHASALDIGLEHCNSEFFVAMHSDTIVKKENWLTELVGYFESNEQIACVGSGKLEDIPWWKTAVKKATNFKALKRRLFYNPQEHDQYRYHNRTICSLYRTEILQREKLSFLMGKEKHLTSGQGLYLALKDRRYKTVELPSSVMGQYVLHLNHATMVLNCHEFRLRERTIKKYKRFTREVMSSELIQTLSRDESLDQ
ncbi:MAG: glycosyltransferase [Sedimentisphaerales bacterium]|nr:glycosyltransferase [Sedimentisphaerales bacterium]